MLDGHAERKGRADGITTCPKLVMDKTVVVDRQRKESSFTTYTVPA